MTLVYTSLVKLDLLCSRVSLTTFIATPAASESIAAPCRRSW
jgi:hypothetical protein